MPVVKAELKAVLRRFLTSSRYFFQPFKKFVCGQCFGSGSGSGSGSGFKGVLDPDPDPDSESGSGSGSRAF